MPHCQLITIGITGHLGLSDCRPPTGSRPSLYPITIALAAVAAFAAVAAVVAVVAVVVHMSVERVSLAETYYTIVAVVAVVVHTSVEPVVPAET